MRILQHFQKKFKFFPCPQKVEKTTLKVAQKNSHPLFFLLPWAAQTAQTEELMFQIPTYRPTVYRTEAQCIRWIRWEKLSVKNFKLITERYQIYHKWSSPLFHKLINVWELFLAMHYIWTIFTCQKTTQIDILGQTILIDRVSTSPINELFLPRIEKSFPRISNAFTSSTSSTELISSLVRSCSLTNSSFSSSTSGSLLLAHPEMAGILDSGPNMCRCRKLTVLV